MEKNNLLLNVVLLGKTGAGKSLSGNTILGRQAFISKKSPKSVTQDVTMESGSVNGFPVTVYDTPGLYDPKLSEEKIEQMINEKVLQKCSSGLWVFLLVIRADRFTEEDRKTVEKIEKMLGQNRVDKTWILFTRGDELEEENTTIQEFIEETEELKTLVQKYEHRYHLFNNKRKMKKKRRGEQVKMLFTKILKPYLDAMAGAENLLRKIPANVKLVSRVSDLQSRRIVLVGKSGVGKSAAGNTILGQKEFRSVRSTRSVTSKCSAAQTTVSGRSVSVVDTPGFFDTQMKPEELMKEIAKSVYISSPGPHAFLIVFRIDDRFTEQEEQIPQMIELLFGEEVLKYSIILFTHGDQLYGEPVEKLIEENCRLRSVVQQCGGRYHVFNNRDKNNREQVEDLLQKIDSMIQQNGGGHYTNQMYEDAQIITQDEEEQIQSEQIRKQQKEKWRQDKIEIVGKDTVSKEIDKSRGFKKFFKKHKRFFYFAAVVAGIAVGGVAGLVPGAIAGGAIGGVVGSGTLKGAVGGAVAGAAVAGGFAAAPIIGGGYVGVAVCESVIGTAAGAVVGGVNSRSIAGAVDGAICGAAVGGVFAGSVIGMVGFGGTTLGAVAGAVAGGVVIGGTAGAAAGGVTSRSVSGACCGAVSGAAVGIAAGAAVAGVAVGGAAFGGAAAVSAVAGIATGGTAAGGAAAGGAAVGGAAAGGVVGSAVGVVCAEAVCKSIQTDHNM